MPTDYNLDTLARTIWGEARGEGRVGMTAVASVVANRVALAGQHPHFGDGTFASACLAPWQFSCWNKGDPNRMRLEKVTNEDLAFSLALEIAGGFTSGALRDITGGATYYYVKDSQMPLWAVGHEPCGVIGHHLFFKNIA